MKANILGFNGFVLSVVGDVPVNNKVPVVTSSIFLEDLAALSSKVLIRVGFACVHS